MKAITKEAVAHGLAVAGYMAVVKGVTYGVDKLVELAKKKKGA